LKTSSSFVGCSTGFTWRALGLIVALNSHRSRNLEKPSDDHEHDDDHRDDPEQGASLRWAELVAPCTTGTG
jgi:hypothetical protein